MIIIIIIIIIISSSSSSSRSIVVTNPKDNSLIKKEPSALYKGLHSALAVLFSYWGVIVGVSRAGTNVVLVKVVS